MAHNPRNKNIATNTQKPLHHPPQLSSQIHNTHKIRSPLLPTPPIPKSRPPLLPTPTHIPSRTSQNSSYQPSSYQPPAYQHPLATNSTNPSHINIPHHQQSVSHHYQNPSVTNPSSTYHKSYQQQQSPQFNAPQQTHINNIIKMVYLILTNSFEHDYNENNISLTLDRARQYATATSFIPAIQFYDNNEARIQRAATAISARLPYSDIIQLTPNFFI